MGWRPCYWIPDDSSAFWELAKMQMDFPGALCCHLLASGQACSLWWPQTTHLHFGSWPKCRWTFPQRCAAICWLQVGHAVSGGPRRPICINLHFAGGSKCRWNDQMPKITVMNCHLLFCQTLKMQMTVSHNPKFPAAFCDSSRMQICYWRKPLGLPVWIN